MELGKKYVQVCGVCGKQETTGLTTHAQRKHEGFRKRTYHRRVSCYIILQGLVLKIEYMNVSKVRCLKFSFPKRRPARRKCVTMLR